MEQRIRTLRAPTQRVRYSEPIKIILIDKKIKLNLTENNFIFHLSAKQPNMLYIVYKSKIIRLNKLLQNYTKEHNIQKQVIALLRNPTIIQSIELTIILLESIYIFSDILI